MQTRMTNPALIIPQAQIMTKRSKVIYWIATVWLALGMVSTAAVQLFKAKEGQGGADMVIHLGYPVYLLTVLGIWKLLGVGAVLIPKFPLLKEWAYAGFFFVMSGAIFSHIASGDPLKEIFPSLLLLILTLVSWFFRPADRKVTSFNQ
jgi:DoxX-like family